MHIDGVNLERWGSADLARQEESEIFEQKQIAKEKVALERIAKAEAQQQHNKSISTTKTTTTTTTTTDPQQNASTADNETKQETGDRTLCAPDDDPLMALFHAAQPNVSNDPNNSTSSTTITTHNLNQSKSSSSSNNNGTTGKITVNHRINRKICLWFGDMCRLRLDAIVNTTNERLDDTTGISGRIIKQSGSELHKELNATYPEGCRTGSSIISNGHSLPAHRIIHTVGPRWNVKYKTAAENALHGCYRSSLQILLENNLATISFPCVYTERKKYPRQEAVHTALRTVRRFLDNFGDRIACVVFCVEKEEDRLSYVEHLPYYFPRNGNELKASHKQLPSNLGNEWGELILNERTIRIGSLPKGRHDVDYIKKRKGGGDVGNDEGEGGVGDESSTGNNCSSSNDQRRHQRYGSALALDEDFVTMMDDMDSDRLAQLEHQRKGMRNDDGTTRTQGTGNLDVEEINELYQAYLMEAEETDLTDIMRLQCFYKPGVDHKDRPVFSIVLKLLPPGTDMHRVMLYVIQKMDQVVEEEYVVCLVLTDSDSDNRPEFAWLQQMYYVFDQKYKKNMKQLYVIHPNIWFKLGLWFMSPMLSSSIWNKIVYVHELRDLYHMFKPSQLLLPEFVYRYDREVNASSYGDVQAEGL